MTHQDGIEQDFVRETERLIHRKVKRGVPPHIIKSQIDTAARNRGLSRMCTEYCLELVPIPHIKTNGVQTTLERVMSESPFPTTIGLDDARLRCPSNLIPRPSGLKIREGIDFETHMQAEDRIQRNGSLEFGEEQLLLLEDVT